MDRHTPGPWKVIGDAGHPSNARITSTARRHIAKVYASDLGADPMCEANADLIAAAPDLLAACRAAANLLEDARLMGPVDDVRVTLRAAIAKAVTEP